MVRFIVGFVIAILVQVLILNQIHIRSSIAIFGIPIFTPIIYPIILLVLPLSIPHWLLMILGFLTGLMVDMFSNTPGMHAAACVLLTFVRPSLLNLFFQQNSKDIYKAIPNLYRMGFQSFIIYSSVCIALHHFVYYLLQIWSLSNIHIILFKTIVSGILSMLLILIAQLLFAKREHYKS